MKKYVLINASVQTGVDSQKVKVSTDDSTSGFLEDKLSASSGKVVLTTLNPGGNEVIDVDLDETQINHNNLLNYDINEHRELNDAATTTTNLWSADKIQTELDEKVNRVVPVADNRLLKSVGTTGVDLEETAITVDDLGNVTGINDLIVTGDFTVNGTTTTVNSNTLDVVDANITVNKDGTQASAQAASAGLTVEMSDATDAVIGYDLALTSKWKAGESGDLREIATVSHTQTLNNKTINGGALGTNTVITTSSNTEYDNSISGLVADNAQNAIDELDERIDALEAEDYKLREVINVAKNGNDSTADGSIALPYLTIQAAIDDILDASSSKRYSIQISPGRYVENITLKPYVYLTGLTEDSVIIDSTVPMGVSAPGRFIIEKLTIAGASANGGIEIDTTGFASGTNFIISSCSINNVNGFTFIGRGSGSDYLDIRDSSFPQAFNVSGVSGTLYDSLITNSPVFDTSGTVNDAFGFRSFFTVENCYLFNPTVQDTANAVNLAQFYACTLEGTITFTGNVIANSVLVYLDSISYPTTGSTLNTSGQTSINLSTNANSMGYIPSNAANWINPDPTTVQEALDDAAGRISSLEGTTSDLNGKVNDLITLSGVAANSTDLGAFSGSIITDNNTVKGALQELEDAIGETVVAGTASGANNQSVLADVTGLNFSTTYRSFKMQINAEIDADSDLFTLFDIEGIRTASGWVITQSFNGDVSNISFDITAGGQLQYVSDNYIGFVSLDFNWKVISIV